MINIAELLLHCRRGGGETALLVLYNTWCEGIAGDERGVRVTYENWIHLSKL